MAGAAIGAAAGGAADIFKILYGVYQNLHGNHKLSLLEQNRPQYQVDKNILYNQQLAGQTASQGLPDSTKNFYGDNIDRGLSSTIQAGKDTGQGLGFINDAFQNSTDSFRQLLAMDASQKLANQQVLMGANKDVRDENLRAFDVNKWIPYQNEYSRWTNMTNSGAQNIYGGAKSLGNDAMLLGADGNGGGGEKIAGNTDSTGNSDWINWYIQNMGGNNYGGSGWYNSQMNKL